jgi:hypothetical protein
MLFPETAPGACRAENVRSGIFVWYSLYRAFWQPCLSCPIADPYWFRQFSVSTFHLASDYCLINHKTSYSAILVFFVARARRWMIFDLAAPAFECSWCFYHHCTWGPTFPNIMLEYRVWKRLKRTRSHIMGQTWIKSRPQQVMLCNYLSHRGFLSGCSRNETHNSKA